MDQMLGIGERGGVVPGVGIHDDQGDRGGAEALDGSLGESEGEECNDGDELHCLNEKE